MSRNRCGRSGQRATNGARRTVPKTRLAAVLAALSALIAAPLAADALEARLQQLADQAKTPLQFEETRSSGLLSEPITVRGRLIYDPVTRQLTKQVDSPRPARLSVTETHLVAQVGDGRVRRLPLARRPDLAALLVAVRAMLAGQADAIEAQFETTLDSNDDTGDWTLSLRPRNPELARDLNRLEVLGTGDRVHTLRAILDNTVQRMRILPPESAEPAEPEAPPRDGDRPVKDDPATADHAH